MSLQELQEQVRQLSVSDRLEEKGVSLEPTTAP
jgi:hypothetical protein